MLLYLNLTRKGSRGFERYEMGGGLEGRLGVNEVEFGVLNSAKIWGWGEEGGIHAFE